MALATADHSASQFLAIGSQIPKSAQRFQALAHEHCKKKSAYEKSMMIKMKGFKRKRSMNLQVTSKASRHKLNLFSKKGSQTQNGSQLCSFSSGIQKIGSQSKGSFEKGSQHTEKVHP